MRTRTLSITRTWTSRHSSRPEWLLGVHHLPVTIPAGTDPEQGREEMELSRTASAQSEGHGISSAFSRPGMLSKSVSTRVTQVSMAVDHC